jgi:hypothetical protein
VPAFLPVAHIVPRGTRIAFCGYEVLGIPPGDQPYELCKDCQRVRDSDFEKAAWHSGWKGDF